MAPSLVHSHTLWMEHDGHCGHSKSEDIIRQLTSELMEWGRRPHTLSSAASISAYKGLIGGVSVHEYQTQHTLI